MTKPVSGFGWDYHFDQKDGLVIQNDKVKLENPENEGWDSRYPIALYVSYCIDKFSTYLKAEISINLIFPGFSSFSCVV